MCFTCILWETNGQRRFFDFLFKEILFVEKEDDGRVREPLVVTNRIEEFQTFLHSILLMIEKNKQIFTNEVNLCLLKNIIISYREKWLRWSRLHEALDRIRTWPRKKWWPWRPQSNGSTSSARNADLQRRTIWRMNQEKKKTIKWKIYTVDEDDATSDTHLKLRFLNEKWTSTMPVVLTRVRRISCSVGW